MWSEKKIEPIQFLQSSFSDEVSCKVFLMERKNENWFTEFVRDILLFQSTSRLENLYGVLLWIIMTVFFMAMKNLVSLS
jgi:hypothetical protein